MARSSRSVSGKARAKDVEFWAKVMSKPATQAVDQIIDDLEAAPRLHPCRTRPNVRDPAIHQFASTRELDLDLSVSMVKRRVSH